MTAILAVASTWVVSGRAGAAPAADHYARGVQALVEKDGRQAAGELWLCTLLEPAHEGCWWELGWARYLQRDWDGVVEAWQTVVRLAPQRTDVAGPLVEARRQAELTRLLAEGRLNAPPPPPRLERPAESLRLRAVGDVMLGTEFPAGHLPPEDGAFLLEAVAPLLRDADLTFVNLEGPLCDAGESDKCRKGGNCYAFRSPTRYGRYLKDAGVDLASTANNHAGDFGEACRRETEATLDALGIAWSGPPGTFASTQARGLRVAMIAFHSSPSGNWLNDQDTAEAMVRAAAEAHDLVLVSFHGGAEGRDALRVPHGPETFYGENRGDLRKFARGVVEAGADLVIGHGPHVMRAMELYQGRLIAYSLGNFATYGRFNLSGPLGLGAVLEVTVARDGRFLGGRILATQQLGAGVPVPDPEGRAADLVRMLSAEDFPETGLGVAQDGTLLTPPEPTTADAS